MQSYVCKSAAQVMSMSEGPVDGVEFLPLDFSQSPTEHRHLDVILHKLSEDIMHRYFYAGGPGLRGVMLLHATRKMQPALELLWRLKILPRAHFLR